MTQVHRQKEYKIQPLLRECRLPGHLASWEEIVLIVYILYILISLIRT